MSPWLAQQRNPAMSPHKKGKEKAPVTLKKKKKTSVEKNQQSLEGGERGRKWLTEPSTKENWTRQWITWSMWPATGHAHAKGRWPQALKALLVVNSFKLHLNAFNNCIAKMEVGCLEYPGASTIGSQPLDWNNAPMTCTTAQPSHEPPHQAEGTSEPWL